MWHRIIYHIFFNQRKEGDAVMKTFKKVLALVLSLVMALSTLTVATAADSSPTSLAITEADVALSATQLPYNGQPQTVTVSVTVNGKALAAGTDYVLGGDSTTQVNSGTYTVTVTGAGKFTGTVSKSFTITPTGEKKTTVKDVKKPVKKTVKSTKKKAKVSVKFKTGGNKGEIEFKVTGGKKKTRKAIKVVWAKAGKKIQVVLPKKPQKGTYKVKFRVKAYNQYKASKWKTVVVTVN